MAVGVARKGAGSRTEEWEEQSSQGERGKRVGLEDEGCEGFTVSSEQVELANL